ncbi:unnamed protein product, partial [Prorocentrum cordatum]
MALWGDAIAQLGQLLDSRFTPLNAKLDTTIRDVKALDEKLDSSVAEMHMEQASLRQALSDLQAQVHNSSEIGSTPCDDDMAPGDAWSRASSSLVTSAQLEARLVKTEQAIAETVTASLSTTPSSAGSDPWSSFERSSGAKRSHEGAPVRHRQFAVPPSLLPPTPVTGTGDRCEVWIRGFPRKLLSRVFHHHFAQVTAAADLLLDDATAQCQSYNYCYNIRFPSEDAARAFFSWGKESSSSAVLSWWGPTKLEDVTLRWGYDQALHIRRNSFALGKCWEEMKKLFVDSKVPRESYTLGSNPHAGFLHLT